MPKLTRRIFYNYYIDTESHFSCQNFPSLSPFSPSVCLAFERDAGEVDRPFRLWLLALFPEARESWLKQHESPLEHCPCAFHWKHSYFPLNIGVVSFLTLGDWTPFHKIVPGFEIQISRHLINMKFHRSPQLSTIPCLIFRATSWSYKDITFQSWASICTILRGSGLKAFHSLIIVHDPISHRNLGHRHSAMSYWPHRRVPVVLHTLQLHGNTRRSCTQFVFLVRIGRNFELVAPRHLLLFRKFDCVMKRFFKADAIIASSISKWRKLCCPVIDRDVTSSSIDLATSPSLIHSTVTWGSAVRRQTSVLKLTFQLWSSKKVWTFSKILLCNRNTRIIHHKNVRISSTSMIRNSIPPLEVKWLSRRNQWFPFHISPCCLWNIRSQNLTGRCQILWIAEDFWGLSFGRSKTSAVPFSVLRGNPESQRGKVLELRIVEVWSGTWVAPELLRDSGSWNSLASDKEFTLFCKSWIWAIVWLTLVGFLRCCTDNSSLLPCLACSISSQPHSSQFFNFLAISCMTFLENSISQFKFSIQANFISLSLICPSACLIQSKSVRPKPLIDFLERIVSISLFPILRLNLRLSLIQFLLSLFSLDGQVNFPFKDLLEMISISQRMHKF